MLPHYLVKRKSSVVRSVQQLLLQYKYLTSPVHNEINIHITTVYCVLSSMYVQLTEVIRVFPSK